MPAHRRRSPWYVLPVALATLTIASFALAVQAERADSKPKPLAASAATTPVLSARRVPSVLAAPVADERLQAQLQQLVDSSPGAMCVDVQTDGREVFQSAVTSPLVPASLEKLLTGTVALEVLGADTTLSTVVRAGAAPHDGVVDGDLYLVGGGDPLLMTDAYHQHFEHPPPERTDPAQLADAVVAAGVKEVTGRVVGDDSRYDNAYYPRVWPTRYATEAEAGPASALTLDQGLDAFPPTHDDKVPKEHPAANPPAHAAVLFTDLLQARGVKITSPPASGVEPDGAVDVASLPSAPVSGLVAEMLRESDNTTAELLTKEIGLHAGTGGTTAAGVAAITAEATTLGLPVDGTVQVDGSGLSDNDRTTCAMVTALLDRAGPNGPLASGLPIAGQTGTLEKRFLELPVAGRLRAKTGTLNQVTALAGLLQTAKGAGLTFSYVLNIDPSRRIGLDDLGIQDGLVQILDSYPQGPDLALLGPQP